MNIVSIFAGRKANIEILAKYLRRALDLKIIDEVHFWNNTRNTQDEDYLKTISNLKRTSSSGCGNYVLITPVISANTFNLNIRAKNDIHIKLTDTPQNIEYEIVIGGWDNTISVIRENQTEVSRLVWSGIADEHQFIGVQVQICEGVLCVLKNNVPIFNHTIQSDFQIDQVFCKTGYGAIGVIEYTTTQNDGFYFMDTCEKNWRNYYNYYNESRFENDIIIKCDDDIVFIDLHKLPEFISFVRNSDYDLVLANTINNGVAAYYQQHKYNLIPSELMELEYPDGGLCGSLWESGQKAGILHNYFIDNHTLFLNYEYNQDIVPIDTRFSINFFGYKGKNWNKIRDCHDDDEYNLTVEYVRNRQFRNVLYSELYVSHLSFYLQTNTGLPMEELIHKYTNLYYITTNS